MAELSVDREHQLFRPERASSRQRRLIVMTRIPEAGRVKTRLIPTLGAEGAAALHEALLHRTLQIADAHAGARMDVDVDVRFTGGDAQSAAAHRTGSAIWREQQGGDLGERMHLAAAAAFDEGARQVVVIGTDCPELNHEILDRTWNLLEQYDVVFGPAEDGGFYLVALKLPDARLFKDITWGTEQVLQQTLERCRTLGKAVGLLPMLGDIDEPENLVSCRRLETGFEHCLPQSVPGLLSVVIPTLNEAGQLAATLQPLLQKPDCEVIVADGGSTDGTVELAQRLGCQVVTANRGRGKQMNAGAAVSRGEYLLFLHADTRVHANFRSELLSVLTSGAIAGAFRFQIDHPGWGLRCVEWGTTLRAKYLQLPYGDQGFFLRSRDFFQIGGFKNWPIMEDFELCRRLGREGRIGLAPSAAPTSGRRWRRLGVWRTMLINQLCIAGFRLGISPERLAGWYSSHRGRSVDQWRHATLARLLLVAGILLSTASLVLRTRTTSSSMQDSAHDREVLTQMMEHNRRAFPDADEVDVTKMLEIIAGGNCVLVDVRTAEERRVSMIPGAISVEEYERTIKEHSGKLIICYCTIGYRSANYAQEMKRKGIAIASFNGSLVAWCQAGQNLITPDGLETTQVHVYGPEWDLVPPEYQSKWQLPVHRHR